MISVVLGKYEISRLVRDKTLYQQVPELLPVKTMMDHHAELANTAPKSSCCGRGGVATPAMNDAIKGAVNTFINIVRNMDKNGIDRLKARFRADKLEIIYRTDTQKLAKFVF